MGLFGNFGVGGQGGPYGGAASGFAGGFHPFARSNVDIYGRYLGPPIQGRGTLAIDPMTGVNKMQSYEAANPLFLGRSTTMDKMGRGIFPPGGMIAPDTTPGMSPAGSKFVSDAASARTAAPISPTDAWNRAQYEAAMAIPAGQAGYGAGYTAPTPGQPRIMGWNNGQPLFDPRSLPGGMAAWGTSALPASAIGPLATRNVLPPMLRPGTGVPRTTIRAARAA